MGGIPRPSIEPAGAENLGAKAPNSDLSAGLSSQRHSIRFSKFWPVKELTRTRPQNSASLVRACHPREVFRSNNLREI
jgi:aspartyl/asparaginyl beta-hydroxylase (cupin superfamily)